MNFQNTNHDGQVFIVDDVLHFCDDDPSGVLIVELGRLKRRNDVQVIHDAIVLTNPNRVHQSK